jgi:hypothetical protein
MQQYHELGFLNINLLFHVHRAMIQVQDVVTANLTFTGQNLTSEYTVRITITSFDNQPILYLMGYVCGDTVIYPSASTHLGDFDFDL